MNAHKAWQVWRDAVAAKREAIEAWKAASAAEQTARAAWAEAEEATTRAAMIPLISPGQSREKETR